MKHQNPETQSLFTVLRSSKLLNIAELERITGIPLHNKMRAAKGGKLNIPQRQKLRCALIELHQLLDGIAVDSDRKTP